MYSHAFFVPYISEPIDFCWKIIKDLYDIKAFFPTLEPLPARIYLHSFLYLFFIQRIAIRTPFFLGKTLSCENLKSGHNFLLHVKKLWKDLTKLNFRTAFFYTYYVVFFETIFYFCAFFYFFLSLQPRMKDEIPEIIAHRTKIDPV